MGSSDFNKQFITKYLIQRGILPGIAIGVGSRAIIELFRNIALQRAKAKREKQIRKIYRTHEVDVPYLKTSSERLVDEKYLPYYMPFIRNTLAGVAAYLSWKYLSSKFNKMRQNKLEGEIQKLKKQLDEELLRHNAVSKLASQPLTEVKNLDKEAAFHLIASPSMLFLLALLGSATYPWASDRKAKIDAYNAYMNEKLLNRGLPLSIKPHPITVIKKEEENSEKQAAFLAKKVLPGLSSALKYLSWRVPLTIGSALGGSYLMTNTSLGREWLKARFKDLMKDPNYAREQLHTILRNPNLWKALKGELASYLQKIQQRALSPQISNNNVIV